MDPVLLIVTSVSLAVAAGTSVVLMRVLREERRRSAARVALLTELAADEDDLVLRTPDSSTVDHPALFQGVAEPTPWIRRALVICAVAAVLIAGAWLFTPFGGSGQREHAVSAQPTRPLELLSLRHSLEDGVFTVTGLVQNPAGGRPLTRVEAAVLVFDPAGTMVTTARAPLDFTTLAAGDESPFVIRFPVAGTVARYRVSFRGPDGGVLGHVDRRNLETVVRREEP